jgi:gluconokinase
MPPQSQNEWYLGVDLGTGSCKSIIVDETATVLGFGASDYSTGHAGDQWGEQEPDGLVYAMIHSVRSAIKNTSVSPHACRGMSVTGALHSVLAIDRNNRPLTGIITWIDNRARDEAPEVFNQSTRFISGKEYVVAKLSGDFMVDPAIAAGSGMLNTHRLVWDESVLEIAGISERHLSPVVNPRTVVQGINPQLAQEMGIPDNISLVLGSADAVNSSIGAGALSPEVATLMIGTSGAVRIIANRPILDPKARSWCYAIDDHSWLVGGAINNGGLALSWMRQVLNQLVKGGESNGFTYEELISMAGEIGPGSDSLICLPFFAGERSPGWDINARGVFFGLGLQHRAPHMIRALMEGVSYRLRSVLDVLEEISGGVSQIRASGGFTNSDLWLQIISSSVYGLYLGVDSPTTSKTPLHLYPLLIHIIRNQMK